MSTSTISAPQIKSIHARGRWAGALKTNVETGHFTFDTAEPRLLGGDDSAPTPMDYFVGGFLGCITVLTELVAAELDIHLHELRHVAVGRLDRRGFAGLADVSPSFQSVTATIYVECDATAEQFNRLVAEVEKRCPAYNLFKDAGVEPDVAWLLNGSKVPA